MIIPGAFSVFNMIIARTFFQTNIPESLTEAAKIDGASEARIFVQIVLPLSGSIIAVFTLFNAVGQWNSYFNAMLFLNNSKFYPLQLVLRKILVLNENINTSSYVMSDDMMDDLIRRQKLAQTMKYALIIISNLPVLIAYPFVQKYFVKGVLIGSIKG
jgi:ABC-type glycerol-3-phosphate transport system permease component